MARTNKANINLVLRHEIRTGSGTTVRTEVVNKKEHEARERFKLSGIVQDMVCPDEENPSYGSQIAPIGETIPCARI